MKNFEESIARALEAYWKYSSFSSIEHEHKCKYCENLLGRPRK